MILQLETSEISQLLAGFWRNGWLWPSCLACVCLANDRIATKLPHDGPQVTLHPRCAEGQGQLFISWVLSLWLAGKFPSF